MAANRSSVLVVGAGDSLGSAIARTFLQEGHAVCAVRRSKEGLERLRASLRSGESERLHLYPTDARNEEQVSQLFAQIEGEIGPLEVVIFNVGAWYRESILTITAKKYFKIWEMACFAGFLVGREAARRMVSRGRGTIIFTGATASLRGASEFAAFAGAKHGLRALAQSMARELGPRGVHVAHVVIDGPIDTPFTRDLFPQLFVERPPDGILLPDDIASNYVSLCRQPRSAWTHEMDLRSWAEPW